MSSGERLAALTLEHRLAAADREIETLRARVKELEGENGWLRSALGHFAHRNAFEDCWCYELEPDLPRDWKCPMCEARAALTTTEKGGGDE